MEKNNDHGKNMLLITTYWNQDKVFKLMPLVADCPFIEVIYDLDTHLLIPISKADKQNFEMLPKLDDNGELTKSTKPRANKKEYREQRVLMTVKQEYYITEEAEQIAFIERFAVNAKEFDFKKFMVPKKITAEKLMVPKAPKLLDEKGKELVN